MGAIRKPAPPSRSRPAKSRSLAQGPSSRNSSTRNNRGQMQDRENGRGSALPFFVANQSSHDHLSSQYSIGLVAGSASRGLDGAGASRRSAWAVAASVRNSGNLSARQQLGVDRNFQSCGD